MPLTCMVVAQVATGRVVAVGDTGRVGPVGGGGRPRSLEMSGGSTCGAAGAFVGATVGGVMLTRQRRAPVGSRVPWKTLLPFLSVTWSDVLSR